VTGNVGDPKYGTRENLLITAVRRSDRGREYPDLFATHTDRAGQFRWDNLPPGEWDLFAFEESEAFHCLRGALLSRFLPKSKPVVLQESGRMTGVTLPVISKAELDAAMMEVPQGT